MSKFKNHSLRNALLLCTSILMVLSPLSANASRRHHIHHYRHITITFRRNHNHKRGRRHVYWKHKKLYYVSYKPKSHKIHRNKVRHHKLMKRTANSAKHRKHSYTHINKRHSHKKTNIYGYNLDHHSDYISPRIAHIENGNWTPNSNKINTIEGQISMRTLRDINKDRAEYKLAPVSDSETLNDLAEMRSQQIQNNFNHYDSQGQRYTYVDGKLLGMNPEDAYDIGENISEGTLGDSRETGDPNHYYNTNAKQIADMEDNSMVNDDQSCGNGHRDNTLSPDAVSVGIANSYDPNNQSFYLAEEYSSENMN